MRVFHGTVSLKDNHDDVLRHFSSSMDASIHRFNSMIVSGGEISYDGQKFIKNSSYGGGYTIMSMNEFIENVISFFRSAVIHEIYIDVNNSLRLSDCWEDDPIGSGAMQIFNNNTQLTHRQRTELEQLFSPYTNIIYPVDVFVNLSEKQRKALKKKFQNNRLYQLQLQIRKNRSKVIGENFKRAANHEFVWIDKTLKLREWALQNDYDSFVYLNNGEGYEEDSYVTLRTNQRIGKGIVHHFDEPRFRAEIAANFQLLLNNAYEKSKKHPNTNNRGDLFWVGQNPLKFWKRVP